MAVMTFGQTVWTLVIGSALTAFGAAMLFLFQAAHSARTDRRGFRRQWHTELVDLIVDVDLLVDELQVDRNNGGAWMFPPELKRRLRRAGHGHPDGKVRFAAFDVERSLQIVETVTAGRESGSRPAQRNVSSAEVARTRAVSTAIEGVSGLNTLGYSLAEAAAALNNLRNEVLNPREATGRFRAAASPWKTEPRKANHSESSDNGRRRR